MAARPESKDLKEVKEFLSAFKVPEDNIVEFYGTEDGIEALKEKFRLENNDNCYFFSRKEGEDYHLIAVINIKGFGEALEKLKELESLIKVNYSNSQKSNFNPKGLNFDL